MTDFSARLGSSGISLGGAASLGPGAVPQYDFRSDLIEVLIIVGLLPPVAAVAVLVVWMRAMAGA